MDERLDYNDHTDYEREGIVRGSGFAEVLAGAIADGNVALMQSGTLSRVDGTYRVTHVEDPVYEGEDTTRFVVQIDDRHFEVTVKALETA